MSHRPWPLILLAVFQFLSPFGNLYLSSKLMGWHFGTYIEAFIAQHSALRIFETFAVYFIAGFAVYAIKKWSYPVFLGVTGWNMYRIFDSYQQFPQVMSLWLTLGYVIVNLVVVSYFLLPAVWVLYFDPRVRWWEQLPRFEVPLAGKITGDFQDKDAEITDISEGGVFVRMDKTEDFSLDKKVKILFRVLNLDYDFEARVAHERYQPHGYGLQFLNTTRNEKHMMKKLTRAFRALGVRERNPRRLMVQDFTNWVKRFLSTGKGAVPEVQRPNKKS